MLDPVLVRAVVVAAYVVAAALSAWRAASAPTLDPRPWRLAAVAFVLLAIDRQFDALQALTDSARAAALDAGWYDDRRGFQRWLVLALGTAGIVGFGAWLRRQRRASLGSAMTVAAVVFLVCLALARASSQHRVDAFLRDRAAFGLRWQPALELLGAAFAVVGAATAMGGVRRRGSAQRLPERGA